MEISLHVGVPVAALNSSRHSALHKAATYGQEAACSWLLTEGCATAEAIAPDADGQRPSDIARYNGYEALALKLRHHEDILLLMPVPVSSASQAPLQGVRLEGPRESSELVADGDLPPPAEIDLSSQAREI